MTGYIALIRKDDGSDYGVEFPDLPGCVTAGRSLGEARRMAAEALALHVGGLIEDETPLPSPSSLEALMRRPENGEAVAILVEVAEPVAAHDEH